MLGAHECLVCWAIQALWCVYIYLNIQNIYTIYTYIFLRAQNEISNMFLSCFVLARKTHTQQFFNKFCLRPLETNFRLWRPCRICFLGSRRVPKDGDSKLRGDEWNGRNGKHLFIAGRTFFPSFFLPEIFLLWSFISYFCFFLTQSETGWLSAGWYSSL